MRMGCTFAGQICAWDESGQARAAFARSSGGVRCAKIASQALGRSQTNVSLHCHFMDVRREYILIELTFSQDPHTHLMCGSGMQTSKT